MKAFFHGILLPIFDVESSGVQTAAFAGGLLQGRNSCRIKVPHAGR
jgi:hypothetical protein